MWKVDNLLQIILLSAHFEYLSSHGLNTLHSDDSIILSQYPERFVRVWEGIALCDCLLVSPFMTGRFARSSLLYSNRTRDILGSNPVPEPGQVSKDGMLGILIQAYNTRILADERILDWVGVSKLHEKYERKARKLGADALYMADGDIRGKCGARRQEWDNIAVQSFAQTLAYSEALHLNLTRDLCLEKKTLTIARLGSFDQLIWKGYVHAMFILTLTLDVANDFDRYPVNGRIPDIPTSPFQRMFFDTMASELAINAHFQEMRRRLALAEQRGDQSDIAYYQGKLDYFRHNKTNYPYNVLFHVNENNLVQEVFKTTLWDARWRSLSEFRNATKYCREFYSLVGGKLENGTVSLAMSSREIAEWDRKVWEPVKNFSDYHLYLLPYKTKENDTSLYYDENFEYNILASALQNMRAAWDLLDKLEEEMKCTLRESYWFDKVNETLWKMQERFETKQIFSQFSKTMYQLCVKTETDLIGGCTAENHEICMPAVPSTEQQLHINEINFDRSYYKPKWVYTRTEPTPNDVKCEGERTYIFAVNVCRCGVRMDCGSDINQDIKCVLVENDNIRRQCKGSIGYPCQSLPLAPGRHDESCVTGYCDMEQNSCAEDTRFLI